MPGLASTRHLIRCIFLREIAVWPKVMTIPYRGITFAWGLQTQELRLQGNFDVTTPSSQLHFAQLLSGFPAFRPEIVRGQVRCNRCKLLSAYGYCEHQT
jgi:hypothetical protein